MKKIKILGTSRMDEANRNENMLEPRNKKGGDEYYSIYSEFREYEYIDLMKEELKENRQKEQFSAYNSSVNSSSRCNTNYAGNANQENRYKVNFGNILKDDVMSRKRINFGNKFPNFNV
jgi:hypothetical protein